MCMESGLVRLVTGVQISELRLVAQGIQIIGHEAQLPPIDEIIAATGFRPDLSLLREVRLELDPSVESPVALAPLIEKMLSGLLPQADVPSPRPERSSALGPRDYSREACRRDRGHSGHRCACRETRQ